MAKRYMSLPKKVGMIFAVVLAVLITATYPVLASQGDVSSWTTNGTTLPAVRSAASTVAYNGYLYEIGGWNGSAGTTTVYYAPLNANGSVGSWTTSSNTLPQAVRVAATALYNGYIYVIGGVDNSLNRLATVYYAKLNSDGSVGTWSTSSNSLPQALSSAAAVAYNGYVYVLGGFNISNKSTVYYAPLAANGSVGAWSTNTNALPDVRSDASAVVHNGHIYLVGGLDSGYASINSIFHAKINSNGSVGTWSSSSNTLPGRRDDAAVAVSGSYLYVAGGTQDTVKQTSVYYAQLATDGLVDSWSTSPSSLPLSRGSAGGAAYNGYIYTVGGENSSNSVVNTIYYAALTPTSAATYTNAITGDPVALATPSGTDITCSNAMDEAELDNQDNHSYPLGLTGFCFRTNSTNNQVTLTFVTNLAPSEVELRHYNTNSGIYTKISEAIITQTTYNSQAALQVVYTLTDNGSLDTDSASGSIADPVGLALVLVASTTNASSSAGVPNTGLAPQSPEWYYLSIGLGILIISFVTKRSLQSSRK